MTSDTPPTARLHVDGLRPADPALIRARYLAGIPWYALGVLGAAGLIVVGILTDSWWPYLPALAALVLVIQGLALTPRRVRALGYLDAADDLTVASGIMFRSIVTVPYGRIQSVTIAEGPIDRRYGLAKLTLTTASAETSATLHGLPKAEAERLRELLTDRGVSTMAAL